jgi:hypothetical protein
MPTTMIGLAVTLAFSLGCLHNANISLGSRSDVDGVSRCSKEKACVGPEQSKPRKLDQQPSPMPETNVLEEPRPRAI